MSGAVPNIPLRNWRGQQCLSRAELADRINASPTGVAERLVCDEERIRRWESGEVRWPSPVYRRALRAAFILLFFLSHPSPASCRPHPTPLHRLRHGVLALRQLRLPASARKKPAHRGMAN
jgi:hypothetical protein